MCLDDPALSPGATNVNHRLNQEFTRSDLITYAWSSCAGGGYRFIRSIDSKLERQRHDFLGLGSSDSRPF
jgi:hypothetical protein